MDHYEVRRLYDQKLQALQLWAAQQGLSCVNCKFQNNALIADNPCDHCWMCPQRGAGFEPNRGCLLWEPEGHLIAGGQHGGK